MILSAASSAESRLVPASHVVRAVHGTRTVLLDPCHGRYFGLDELGGRIWALAEAQMSAAQIVDQLEQEYDVERAQLTSDVERVLRELQAKELLRLSHRRAAAPRPPSFVTSFVIVTLVDLCLKLFGFNRTLRLAGRLAGRRPARPDAEVIAQEVCRRVALASVFYPGRARCLEQALALYVLLRRRGVPAELRLGVQPYPFNAHAWVELNGIALNEEAEIVRQFVPVEGLAV